MLIEINYSDVVNDNLDFYDEEYHYLLYDTSNQTIQIKSQGSLIRTVKARAEQISNIESAHISTIKSIIKHYQKTLTNFQKEINKS